MRYTIALLLLIVINTYSNAQTDSVVREYSIGLILPFQTETTARDIKSFNEATDQFTASRIQLDEDAITALDFYQGVLQAINVSKDSLNIDLHVYDCTNNDSLTRILLNNPELKKLDMIIGSVSYGPAKLVAEFCKQNHILNVQPFSPSKSLTSLNPYHLKLAPTIDAHVDEMFNSITESYTGANVIIYSPNNETGFNAAKRFDSLFKNYNKTATRRFSTVLLNSKDMLVNGKKTTASEQLKAGVKNIWVITSFEESFVNGNLRVLHSSRDKYEIVVYGMPTWMKGEIMRLDYVNDYSARISDPFWPDTSKEEDSIFINSYTANYNLEPSANAYLGYDVMNFIYRSVQSYGKDFLPKVAGQRYTGVAYIFDVMKEEKDGGINYYENRHVNVIGVKDYRLERVW